MSHPSLADRIALEELFFREPGERLHELGQSLVQLCGRGTSDVSPHSPHHIPSPTDITHTHTFQGDLFGGLQRMVVRMLEKENQTLGNERPYTRKHIQFPKL